MLEILYDIPGFVLESGEDTVACALLFDHWRGLMALGAHRHAPYASLVAPGGPRAELAAALRSGSAIDLLLAYDKAKADGLPEIHDRLEALRRFPSLD